MKKLKEFKSGMMLNARDLHAMHSLLSQIAEKASVEIRSKPANWKTGAILTAASLNNFLKDVEKVISKIEKHKVIWSFGKFEDGQILKAEQLNEIVSMLNKYI